MGVGSRVKIRISVGHNRLWQDDLRSTTNIKDQAGSSNTPARAQKFMLDDDDIKDKGKLVTGSGHG